MKIVILAGGLSPERDVSLSSGSLIANALIENGHRVLLLDVYRGLDTLPKDPDSLFTSSASFSYQIPKEMPDLDALRAECQNGDALIGPNVLSLCKSADRVFLALHGGIGENGQLQATLDAFGIRYTGTGYAGSLLAMDKDIAKRLLRDAGIPTPDWLCFESKNADEQQILNTVGLPCVIKPCSCGSSVGVSLVYTREQLHTALSAAALWDGRILAEKMIVGRELTVGVLDSSALPLVEILPKEGFYDYQNKYQGSTEEVCPAQVKESIAQRAQELSLAASAALRLGGYARFDFLLDAEEQLWCLEANTLPGMTPTSLLPMAAKAQGISYTQLCERILALS
ncbi:MAG: D-alanine--D-alanine ligase [Clostridia bacterium]|nr:D-alanine--D-alanine ligase [Clostridia bacterium]